MSPFAPILVEAQGEHHVLDATSESSIVDRKHSGFAAMYVNGLKITIQSKQRRPSRKCPHDLCSKMIGSKLVVTHGDGQNKGQVLIVFTFLSIMSRT